MSSALHYEVEKMLHAVSNTEFDSDGKVDPGAGNPMAGAIKFVTINKLAKLLEKGEKWPDIADTSDITHEEFTAMREKVKQAAEDLKAGRPTADADGGRRNHNQSPKQSPNPNPNPNPNPKRIHNPRQSHNSNSNSSYNSSSNSKQNQNSLNSSGGLSSQGLQHPSSRYFKVNSVQSDALAIGNDAIVVGADAVASGDQSIAIGTHAIAHGSRSIAAGAGAVATAPNSIALGSESIADREGTVSVGRSGHERQITHVASGTEPTDAVNVTQLRAAMSDTTAYTNRRIGDLQQSITDTARDAYSGVAAATALTMIPDVDRDKVLSIGVGGAVYKGHHAVALGGTARIGENLKVRAGVAMSAGGNTVGVGMSWQW